VAPVHNNQRDGLHRQAIHRGRVSYEPNSLAGGCPFQAGAAGFRSVAEPMRESKVRIKPEKFADHFSQAQLFLRSQTPTERDHLQNALRFELTKVELPAIRERVVALLRHVDEDLALWLADELGIDDVPPAPPTALLEPVASEVEVSDGLSLFARPGDGSIAARRIALLVADGVEAAATRAVYDALTEAGAMARIVGTRLGLVEAADGSMLKAETTVAAMPSVLWDAVVLPAGDEAIEELAANGQVLEFIKDQYRHCKTIWVLGGDGALLDAAGIPGDSEEGEPDPGLLFGDEEAGADVPPGSGSTPPPAAIERFIQALARHRHFERETDPPLV